MAGERRRVAVARAPAERAVPLWRASLRVIIAGALASALMLHIVRLRNGLEEAIASRVGELPLRVVLREDRKRSDAESLADRVREQWPAARVTVVGQEEAEALLGIQEPWMKSLPDLALGTLPTLLEIVHPAVLESSEAVNAVKASLAAEPETDFVAFNDYGHAAFLDFASAARLHVRSLLIGAALVLGVLAVLPLRWRATELGVSALAGALLGLAGGMAGWLLSMSVGLVGGRGDVPLPGPGISGVLLVVGGLSLAFALRGALAAWWNRRAGGR